MSTSRRAQSPNETHHWTFYAIIHLNTLTLLPVGTSALNSLICTTEKPEPCQLLVIMLTPPSHQLAIYQGGSPFPYYSTTARIIMFVPDCSSVGGINDLQNEKKANKQAEEAEEAEETKKSHVRLMLQLSLHMSYTEDAH